MTIWFGESIECSWIFYYPASSWARTSLLNWKFKCQTEWEEMIRKRRGKITRESEKSVWDEEKRSRINYNKRHSFARRDTYQWNRKKLYMKSLEFADADRSNFPPFPFRRLSLSPLSRHRELFQFIPCDLLPFKPFFSFSRIISLDTARRPVVCPCSRKYFTSQSSKKKCQPLTS